jgi:hypothetical protein
MKRIRACFLIFNIVLFFGGLLCLLQTSYNFKRINAIFPSFYYIGASTATVKLS